VDLGPHARVAGNATGPQVRLQHHAQVDGSVATNQLNVHATSTVGGGVGPYVAPPPVPELTPITPGPAPIAAGPHQADLIASGVEPAKIAAMLGVLGAIAANSARAPTAGSTTDAHALVQVLGGG